MVADALRLEVVGLREIDRVHLVERHELQHLDGPLTGERQVREVVVGEHDGLPGRQLVALGDLGVRHLLAVRLGDPLVADPAAVAAAHLMEGHVAFLGRAVELDRDRDEAEGDGALPDRSHGFERSHPGSVARVADATRGRGRGRAHAQRCPTSTRCSTRRTASPRARSSTTTPGSRPSAPARAAAGRRRSRRFPNGVDGKSLLREERPPRHAPTGSARSRLPGARLGDERDTIDYVVVEDRPTLVWAANLAALELHVPAVARRSARRRCTEPDLLVLDLDPGPPATRRRVLPGRPAAARGARRGRPGAGGQDQSGSKGCSCTPRCARRPPTGRRRTPRSWRSGSRRSTRTSWCPG